MYPVQWRGKEYTLGNITVEVKAKFVAWAKQHLKAAAIELLSDRDDLLQGQFTAIMAGVWWADGVMSKPLADVLRSPAGGRQLNRLLFGDSAKILSDSDLDALLDEKEKDPTSDYILAMNEIREHADPKAKAAATGPDPPGG